MADLVASDVTLTIQKPTGRSHERVSPREKKVLVKVAFGDGVKTYPALGVPLPTTPSNWGLIRNLNRLEIVDQDDGSGILWKLDHENKKLRGYRQGVRTGSTAAADSVSGALIEDFAAAETTLRGMGTAIDTDIDLGLLRELTSAGNPPAAQTLFLHAYGW